MPWKEILDVTSIVLKTPPQTIEQLQSSVARVHNFAVRIVSSSNATIGMIYILKQMFTNIKLFIIIITICIYIVLPETNAVVTLVGDARVTAHYRLGVGVNAALSSMSLLANSVAMQMFVDKY
jgi:hypothetical protein